MSSVICTLFEGQYHYGVGALCNSLCRHGFRGDIVAGYRGPLPPWAGAAEQTGCLPLNESCRLRFVRLEVAEHFSNYKPRFMMDVLDRLQPDAQRVFYFDPDVLIKCDWAFFEEWVEGGVALCEDINSPMAASHPIRHTWRRVFAERGIPLHRALDFYVNAGFVGLHRRDRALLECWSRLLGVVGEQIGSLEDFSHGLRPGAFHVPDQDALNAALMAIDTPFSLVGQDGMDFKPGGYIMSHAIGTPKPWNKRLIRNALRGVQPSLTDKSFWQNAEQPIELYSAARLHYRRLTLWIAAGLGRMLKRA